MKTLRTDKKAIVSTTLVAALGAVFVIGLPAQARFDWDNWQPVQGTVHKQQDCLEKRINRDYNQGKIDSCEMAQLRRDLDGIGAQEDEFRMDHNGLSQKDQQCMQHKLNQFKQDLTGAEADKNN